MRVRSVLLLIPLALAGCESIRAPVAKETLNEQSSPTAVGGQPEPQPDDDPLTLAAECLQRGDEPTACVHLEVYVREHPDQPMFRLQLAELLLRTGKPESARFHLERFVAAAQENDGPLRSQLIGSHTRLMEIAQQTDDPFGEQFHRGVGLLLVARQQESDPDHDAGFREEVLCKAAKALIAARELRPDDARARLYLADVYARMGNHKGADAERKAARNATQPGSLTPTEQKRLALPIE